MFTKKSYTQFFWASAILISLCLTSFAFCQGGTWATKAPMPTPRMLGSAHQVKDIIYVIGGTDDPNFDSLTGVPTVEAYDPATDIWTTKAPMPGPRLIFASCVLNGKIYIIGGFRKNFSDYLDIMEEYDPLTDTWTAKAPMPDRRVGVSAAAVGNKIYVIGGFGTEPVNMNPLASVIAYDPATDTWESKAPMSTAKSAMGIAVHNEKIYVFGGAEGWGPLVSIVEEYDPATDTWTLKNDIPTKRMWLSSCSVDGKIYVLGGASTNFSAFTPTDIVEVYDVATDSWERGTTMPLARMGYASCAVDNKIYVLGGSIESGPNFDITSTVHELTPPPVSRIDNTTPIKNPTSFTLQQNYPNPFNPTTTIAYTLKQPEHVLLSIYDMFGRHIRTLVNEEQNHGAYSHQWDAVDQMGHKVSSGIYLYRIEFINPITGREAWQDERKMVLLR